MVTNNQQSTGKMKHGIDAPLVPILYLLVGVIVIIEWSFFHQYSTAWITLVYGIIMVLGGVVFIHTSLRGKFVIWNHILDGLNISKDAQVLDLGCGHGAVLIAFAKRLGQGGHAVGVDLWRNRDQSNNGLQETTQNLVSSNVSDRTELVTADMAKLPLEEDRFDFVVSSFAFHNIKPTSQREIALQEAVRVLKTGGQLVIVDTGHNDREYSAVLGKLGIKNIQVTKTGINGWWSGPWMSSYVVRGVKE